MLFMHCSSSSSSIVGHKRKLEISSSLAQLLVLILWFLVPTNKAGVIKKRDSAVALTQNDNTVASFKATEVAPTVLTAVINNASEIFSTKLQSIKSDEHFATESSRELANNEILINEAKNLMEEENKVKKTKNGTELLIKTGEENPQIGEVNTTKSADILQEFKPATANEFSSNVIKEEKFDKIKEENLVSSFPEDNKNSSSLISTLKTADINPIPPSRILTELRTEIEKSVMESTIQNKQLDNNIENSKEYLRNELNLGNKDMEEATIKPLELTSAKALTSSLLANIEQELPLENSTSVTGIAESLPVLEMSTVDPLKSQIKSPEPLTKADSNPQTNQIYEGELIKSKKNQQINPTTSDALLSLNENTLNPTKEEQDLSIFEANKQSHDGSMFTEQTTTINFKEVDEALTPVTTFKPVISKLKDDIEEKFKGQIEIVNKNDLSTLNLKGKKPKFINDNSTNAQKLNLPNNAEAWSLASMKTLPKANITIETTQTYNYTTKEPKALHNTSLTLNNNSEKNLLDWSQIMMDKELSTTARNDENTRKVEKSIERQDNEDVNTALDSTTAGQQFKILPGVDVITQNSLAKQEFITSTIPPALTSTILSTLNHKENDNGNSQQPDKKVEENINNHIDTVTDTLATTTAATNVDNNPFNTSLNIEPNLNEINLTSNQTQVVLNNDVHTITTAEKTNAVNEDINANTHIETSTVAATIATAVIDNTTVEQISKETTTVSTLKTNKQNTSLNNVVISEQGKNQTNNNGINKEFNSSVSALHNELENIVVDKQNTQNENIDLNTQTTKTITTTTIVPITTFRPTILATSTSSTTSMPSIFEQEVDQNSNEIPNNLTNSKQQSIIKTDLQYTNSTTKAIETHLTEREFETTTTETLTTTAATELTTTSKIKNTHTSFLEKETTTSRDEAINVTTEINLFANEATATTTQINPKQVLENNFTGEQDNTTGSAAFSKDETAEKGGSKTTTTTAETIYALNTSTQTPVVIGTESDKALIESTTPTIAATATIETTPMAEKNTTTTKTTTAKQESVTEESILSKDVQNATTTKIMTNTQEIITSTTATMPPATAVKEEETYISLLEDTTTTISTAATTQATTFTPTSSSSSSPTATTLPPAITTKVEEIYYNVINSTTTESIQTTTQQLLTTEFPEPFSSSEPSSTTYFTELLTPATTTTQDSQIIATADIAGKTLPTLTSIMGGNSGNMYPKNHGASGEIDVNVIIAITVSVIGVIALVLLVGFLYLMRKRQKQTSYSQRCRPVSLDEYTIDNASVSGSMRKRSALRASKRTYGNLAFDDPTLRPNPMGVQELAKFSQEKLRIFEEFRDVPQITSRLDEVPTGCEDKNRYANVLPLPETRVILQRLNDDEKSEYINANYVTGPKDPPNYYIACQAPLESTVEDFWRMIWEQQSRVIIQATDLIENGVEKCAEYLPPSVTLDNHSSFGDFQITLQNREVKDKYAISTILIKHISENSTRELTHYWYKWPEMGVPTEEAPIIAMLLEARSSLISYAIEQANEDKERLSTGTLKSAEESTTPPANESTTSPITNSNGATANTAQTNGNISMVHTKNPTRNQGPLTMHCSPGTGRTGTIIACDIAIRSLETPKRIVDIPQIVYYVRRGRASAVLTKEQYEFIYKVASMYAAKITNPTNYN